MHVITSYSIHYTKLYDLRRRGYTPAAVREFCHRIGVTKSDSTTEMGVLENVVITSYSIHYTKLYEERCNGKSAQDQSRIRSNEQAGRPPRQEFQKEERHRHRTEEEEFRARRGGEGSGREGAFAGCTAAREGARAVRQGEGEGDEAGGEGEGECAETDHPSYNFV